jgi:outer membrane lipoprotein LolB
VIEYACAHRAVVAAAAVVVAACAHVPPPELDGLDFAARRQQLESIEAWDMRGRLAVNTGERAYPGSFVWLQDGERSTLTVRGPLGAGILEVDGTPQRMMVAARGEQRVLEDPEADLSAMLGWWMPVESLRPWLLGLPDARFDAQPQLGAGDVIEVLDQREWHVEYERYQLLDGLLVPRRIDLTHDGLAVRLTVDHWSPEPRQ